VSGTTGIASFDVLSSVAKASAPALIIAVDTLAAGASARLGNCIQLSDRGLEPGGGVNNPTKAISQGSLGMPVVAVGVPLVIYVKRILLEHVKGKIEAEKDLLNLVVTAKEIDFLIKDFSHVIAEAINRIVHAERES
jgi:spore protease